MESCCRELISSFAKILCMVASRHDARSRSFARSSLPQRRDRRSRTVSPGWVPRHLVGYLGLHPTIRQSGNGPARRGRTSKEGSAAARHVLVEDAWSSAKSPGPLRAFAQRTAARRGRHIATVAVAGKLAVLAWHLLTHGEDYAYQQPGVVARKLRRLELAAGAPRRKPGPKPTTVWASETERLAQRRVAEQAEAGYRRLIADWQATGPKVGAGATPERASSKALEGQGRAAG